MPAIIEDTRQHAGKHDAKHGWFAAHGIEVVRRKLDSGDYMRDGSNVTVDTKASVDEVAGNMSAGHRRFRNECIRARDAGLRLVVLVENMQGFAKTGDLYRWTNTHCATCHVRQSARCNPRAAGKCPRHRKNKPIQGDRLAAAMTAMERKYGVRFEFCRPEDSARRICELLGVEYEQDAGCRAQAAFDGLQDAPDQAGN